jgi:hypothetical protein
MTDSWGNFKISGDSHPKRRQVFSLHQKEVEIKFLSAKYSYTSAKLQDLSGFLDDGTLLSELDCLTTTTDLNVSLVNSEMRDKAVVDAATLAKSWGVRIEASKRTRLVTTQRGIIWMIHPSLTNFYKTNDRQLHYHPFPVNFLLTQCTKQCFQYNKTRQLKYAADFGFVRVFPMKLESKAYDAISQRWSSQFDGHG